MSLTSQFVANLKRFRLVTFDVTDTLLHLQDPLQQYHQTAEQLGVTGVDRRKLEQCFRQQFKAMSQEHPNFGRFSPAMDWQQWWLHLVNRTFCCVDQGLPPEKLERIGHRLVALFRTSACWSNVDGAQELVQCVRDAGKSVGIISNFDPSLPKVLDSMGFAGKFDFILTSYEAGVMKPDPGIFEIPLKRLQIPANQALHIGNKFNLDYEGARNCGWSGLLVDGGSTPHSFATLFDLLEALKTREIQW
ncbi:rhythmically expressed gene 2 protein [Drosophila ficusphila]|uniref:rhythmically expressed gene 2 protein n=1 Tax=Drosophila ficusphila TaxID=30025 RepID=UPI0007E86347|nr:rhythmically expressed gene 2 protein [Drosophila ficusphila]